MSDTLLSIFLYIYQQEKITDCRECATHLLFSSDDTDILAITDVTLDIYDVKRLAYEKMTKKIRKVYYFSDMPITMQDTKYYPYPEKIMNLFALCDMP